MNLFNLLIAGEVCNFGLNKRDKDLTAAIDDFVSLAKKGHDINDEDLQSHVFWYNDLENLSTIEKNYIRKCVEGRLK